MSLQDLSRGGDRSCRSPRLCPTLGLMLLIRCPCGPTRPGGCLSPGPVSLDAFFPQAFVFCCGGTLHTTRCCVGSKHSVKIPLAQTTWSRAVPVTVLPSWLRPPTLFTAQVALCLKDANKPGDQQTRCTGENVIFRQAEVIAEFHGGSDLWL